MTLILPKIEIFYENRKVFFYALLCSSAPAVLSVIQTEKTQPTQRPLRVIRDSDNTHAKNFTHTSELQKFD